KLTGQEYRLVYLKYWEELSMREIGEMMRISESRVCKIHMRLLERLKDRFRGSGDEERPTLRDCGRGVGLAPIAGTPAIGARHRPAPPSLPVARPLSQTMRTAFDNFHACPAGGGQKPKFGSRSHA